MHTNSQPKRGNKGFTLIEMIGVLAVIAILAGLLIPKIFQAISSARISSAALACSTVKAATADHYAKNGALGTTGNKFDTLVLMAEGFLDKPFATKIGTEATTEVDLVAGEPLTTTAPDGVKSAYALSGVAGQNDAAGSQVVQAVIPGVSEADAMALSQLIDGTTMSSGAGADDFSGRVKYAKSVGGAAVTVHVYITHR